MRGVQGRVVPIVTAAFCAVLPAVADAQEDERPPREFGVPPAPAAPARPQEFRFSFRYNVSYPRHIDRGNIATLSMASMDVVHFALQDAADDPFYFRLPKWGAAFAIDDPAAYDALARGDLPPRDAVILVKLPARSAAPRQGPTEGRCSRSDPAVPRQSRH